VSVTLHDFKNAVFDIRKLRDYCQNTSHLKGKDRARVFRAALGISQRDTTWLGNEILQNLEHTPAIKQSEDKYGVRYVVNIKITKWNMSAIISTVWMIAHNDMRQTVITCRVV
jgi:hypothetical protein